MIIHLDKNDPCGVNIQLREVPSKDLVEEFDQGSSGLNAGRSPTDNYEIQGAVFNLCGVFFNVLELAEDVASQMNGVHEILNSQRVFLGSLDPKVIWGCSRCKNEIVEVDRVGITKVYCIVFKVYVRDRTHTEGKVFLILKDIPD